MSEASLALTQGHLAVKTLIDLIDPNPDREGLQSTPDRVVKSWMALYGGYKQNPADILTTFKEDTSDEMVILRNVEFYSTCEHHMLPFYGIAHLGYVPQGGVVGISKLARLLDVYARRLQIQERICSQFTAALDKHLEPMGSACVLVARHHCIACRGVAKQHSEMVTSSLTGVFRENPETRAEFMQLIKD